MWRSEHYLFAQGQQYRVAEAASDKRTVCLHEDPALLAVIHDLLLLAERVKLRGTRQQRQEIGEGWVSGQQRRRRT